MKAGEIIRTRIRFTEPVLGTVPRDPEVYAGYIAGRIVKDKSMTEDEALERKAEEVAEAYNSINATEERGWTGFFKDETGYYVFNYWIKGFMKTAIQSMQETKDLNKIPAYKTKIDRFVHILPRRLYFESKDIINGQCLPVMERPLRAMTAQGPRVTVARSDYFSEGTELEWKFELLKNNGIDRAVIREALEFGHYEGLGQWRSGGYGKFDVLKFE